MIGIGEIPATADPTPAAHRRLARALLQVLGSVVGGVVLAFAFPPYDLPWLAPVAVAVLTICWRGIGWRLALLSGALGGFAFFAVHLRWLSVVGNDAWLVLATYCALWLALTAVGVSLVGRLRTWPLLVGLVWVAQEALRGRVPLGGFPWGRVAFSQSDTGLAPYASVGGTPLVTYLTVAVGAGIAYLITAHSRPAVRFVLPVAAATAVLVGGRMVPLASGGEQGGGPSDVTVAVVQGDVPQTGLDAFGQARAVLDNHVRETKLLAADVASGRTPKPELVIWPENSTDIDPFSDRGAFASIQSAVDAIAVPVLVGAVVEDPTDPKRVRNVGIVWGPTGSASAGPGQYYVKRHPVPFGEFVPFRSVLGRLIDRFALVPRDFAPGDTAGILQLGPARIGDLICFEVAYDDVTHEATTGGGGGPGGRMLVVQTNNATYGLTGQAEQQFAITRLRAIEHGRTTVVAATSGISGIVAPDGTVWEQTPEFRATYLVRQVPLRDTLTLADRLGALPEWVATTAAAVAIIWTLWRRRPADIGFAGPRRESA